MTRPIDWNVPSRRGRAAPRQQFSALAPLDAPRRFVPARGGALTLGDVRGPWRASGAVAACGVFAIVWSTRRGDCWAPLHDFAPADQLRLIEQCRWLDQQAGYPGAWPGGRWA